jgi:uncharacterized integral membrane protein (TIGR00698 family)
MSFINSKIKGLILVSAIVFITKIFSVYLYIGSITIAILIGILYNYLYPLNESFKEGVNFAEKYFLSIAIILMAANLEVSILDTNIYKNIYLVIIIIMVGIFSSFIFGKLFKLSNNLSFLIGIGNGVCGSAAIISTSSIIKPKKEDIILSISIINILGTISIFLIPMVIHFFYKGDIANHGIIIGSTIQAIGQVTAAGFMMGNETGEIAILIKMIRILMLIPILLLLLSLSIRNYKITKNISFPFPYFIIGFLFISVARIYGLIPLFMLPVIAIVSKYTFLFAMVAIGLTIPLKSIFSKGLKVFLVGLISFSLQIAACIYLLS